MQTIYVLIVMATSTPPPPSVAVINGVAVSSVEFADGRACEAARSQLRAMLTSAYVNVTGLCVRKASMGQ